MENKYSTFFSNLEITKQDVAYVMKSLIKKDISFPDGVTHQLEAEVSEFMDVKYSLAHCNGSLAIMSAMYGVGIGTGDEVICPSYTWWASIVPALTLGAVPVFCEINGDNLTLDVEDAISKITEKTRAIVVPHLWGNYGDVITLQEAIRKIDNKIYIIEDVSHAVGAKYKGKYLGALGDVGVFSMQANKILPAGEGGMLLTNDQDIYERAIYLGHCERLRGLDNEDLAKYQKTGGGYKFRIHPLGAALALSQLKTLERRIDRQNKLTSYFEKCLAEVDGLQIFNKNIPGLERGGVMNLKGRFEASIKLDNEKLLNLHIKPDYFPLLHLEPLFLESQSKYIGQGKLPQSESLFKRLFNFPVFYRGTREDIDNYIDNLKLCIEA